MNPVTSRYIKQYRDLWKQGETYSRIVSRSDIRDGFHARQHRFARSEASGKNWFSEYTEEKYDSVTECLACYRWFIIPDRLRQSSGRYDLTDIDELLNMAGYSTSLIAEELFCMIDSCLESDKFLVRDLEMIRCAYNGLSGFEDHFVNRITVWGPVRSGRRVITVQPESEFIRKGYRNPQTYSQADVS